MLQPIYDVIITGGGLAGLCLARQLRQEHPDLRILVVEKKKHPVPEAAHKVGESSVEIGAHYFSKVLGLEPHLVERQLYKLGLRYFFTEGDNRDVARRIELGPQRFPRIPSFQLDRGRLENYLLEKNRRSGIDVLDGCKVTAIDLGDPHHRVEIEVDGATHAVKGRWLVDASGRAGLLKRKLGLARPAAHNANAVWFRLGSRIKIDAWSPKSSWQQSMPTPERWMSTVHLMGKGYWTWLIPLASNSHSIGIVADGDLHPYQTMNRFDKAMAWLHRYEPQCGELLEAHRGELDDFLGLHHFAHGCAQVYSGDRWALVGEAGVFTDPFYSPGSDFISISNDLAAELIARDRRGEPIAQHAAYFNRMYLLLFQAFHRLYDGQYPIMGNAQVMTVKVAWDNACYWAISALLYFRRKYRDMAYMARVEGLLTRFFFLHGRMQRRLKEWSDADQASYAYRQLSVLDMPMLRRLQDQLWDDLDDEALTRRLESNFAELERFAEVLLVMASGGTIDRDHGGLENAGVFQLEKAASLSMP